MMRRLHALTIAAALAATAGSAFAQQTPSETGTSADGPITILKNMQAEPDGISVEIGGEKVEDLRTPDYADITGVVHPGANTLTLRWNGPVQKFDFKIAFARTRNNFKNVLVVQTTAAKDRALGRAGSRTFTFTIPG